MRELITIAAKYTRGDQLHPIQKLCATQKTISTRKLSKLVDKLHHQMKNDAFTLRELYNVSKYKR